AAWRGGRPARGWRARPAAARSWALALDAAGQLPLRHAAFQVFALVVQLLGLGERDRHLGGAVLEVQLEWDERESLAARAADELADLVCVQQQLAGAGGRRVVVAPGQVGRDAHSLEPHLAVADVSVRLSQARLAGSQRLDFRSREHEAGLPSLQEVVVMSRPR